VETVYLDHDNVVDLQLLIDKQPADLSAVTKMELVFDEVVISSSDYPDVFDWSEGNGIVHIKLYGVPIERKYYDARLIVYDGSTPHGIVWGVVPMLVR